MPRTLLLGNAAYTPPNGILKLAVDGDFDFAAPFIAAIAIHELTLRRSARLFISTLSATHFFTRMPRFTRASAY